MKLDIVHIHMCAWGIYVYICSKIGKLVSRYSYSILAFREDFEIRTFEGCLDVIKFLNKDNNNSSQQFLSACYMPGPELHE